VQTERGAARRFVFDIHPARAPRLGLPVERLADHVPHAPGVATVLLRSLMVHRERLSDTLNAEDLFVASRCRMMST
jgi:hypothetical protein